MKQHVFISHDEYGKQRVYEAASGQRASVSAVSADPRDFTEAPCPTWAIVELCTLESEADCKIKKYGCQLHGLKWEKRVKKK